MASAFGADLTQAPESAPPIPAWMSAAIDRRRVERGGTVRWQAESWAKDIHRFVVRTDQKLRGISGPFSGFVEIDPTLYAARSRFASVIAAPLSDAQAQWRTMILELFEALFPEVADKTIDRKELVEHGFDESKSAPDVDGYW
ncbi:MAG: hypothetical protein M3376_07050 [Actinomycetota bacterium]|nr:hypothetical protein [Actinomycetota bacterium]